jgi:hypothetical protein
MRRRRRHPTELRVGDVIDFWRVVKITPGRQLTLMAEMKLPGRAILEFQLESLDSQRSKLNIEARFHPAGTLGLLYWYALIPFHSRIFKGITLSLITRAESIARR